MSRGNLRAGDSLVFSRLAGREEEWSPSVLCGLPVTEQLYKEGLLPTSKYSHSPLYFRRGQVIIYHEF
jgi:hypothetical protein